MAEETVCRNCYWLHEIPFYEDWHTCLAEDKNKERKSTKKNSKCCVLYENILLE